MLRAALRFIAGALLGVAIWIHASPAYNTILAAGAELLRPDLDIEAREERIIAPGDDHPLILVPASQLTYNVILLLGLFATNRPLPLRPIAIALAILFLTHIFGIAASIQATYATQISGWSEQRYSPFEQDLWMAIDYAYRLAGMFAIAFALWWLANDLSGERDRPGRLWQAS